MKKPLILAGAAAAAGYLATKGRSARGRRDPMPPFRFLTTGESGWTKLNASTWRWVSAEGPEFMLRKPPNYGEWQVLYTPQANGVPRLRKMPSLGCGPIWITS